MNTPSRSSMKRRETTTQRVQGVDNPKPAQTVPPIMLQGLNILSGLTPKAKLPTGFSTSKIFEAKPPTSMREKSKPHLAKGSASNLHTYTDPTLLVNLGLIKSRSPTGTSNILKGDTGSKSGIFGRTAKKKSDHTNTHLKSTLSVAGLTSKFGEDTKNLHTASRNHGGRAELPTQSSMLGNSLYRMTVSPNATTTMLKDAWGLLSDSNIHNGSLRVLNTQTKQVSQLSDYDWVEPSHDILNNTQKANKKLMKPAKDPQTRGKKLSVHSIEQAGAAISKIAQGTHAVDHYRHQSSRMFDVLYQKSTTSKRRFM